MSKEIHMPKITRNWFLASTLALGLGSVVYGAVNGNHINNQINDQVNSKYPPIPYADYKLAIDGRDNFHQQDDGAILVGAPRPIPTEGIIADLQLLDQSRLASEYRQQLSDQGPSKTIAGVEMLSGLGAVVGSLVIFGLKKK